MSRRPRTSPAAQGPRSCRLPAGRSSGRWRSTRSLRKRQSFSQGYPGGGPHGVGRIALTLRGAPWRLLLVASSCLRRYRSHDSRLTRADPAVQERQRLWRPPVGTTKDAHYGRHDEEPDDRRVYGDCDRQPDADRLDDHDVGQAECEEYSTHDRRSAADQPPALLQSHRDAGLVVAGALVLLLDSADQKDLVVHRHAEDDAEKNHGDARVDRLRGETKLLAEVALLKDENHRAERSRDREEVRQHSFQGQNERAR